MKINARVAALRRHHFGLEFKILKRLQIAVVEQVAARSVAHQLAIHDFPRILVLAGLPARERLAVEQADPALLGGYQRSGEQQQAQNSGGQWGLFHSVQTPGWKEVKA
jgi:hypothetical protein